MTTQNKDTGKPYVIGTGTAYFKDEYLFDEYNRRDAELQEFLNKKFPTTEADYKHAEERIPAAYMDDKIKNHEAGYDKNMTISVNAKHAKSVNLDVGYVHKMMENLKEDINRNTELSSLSKTSLINIVIQQEKDALNLKEEIKKLQETLEDYTAEITELEKTISDKERLIKRKENESKDVGNAIEVVASVVGAPPRDVEKAIKELAYNYDRRNKEYAYHSRYARYDDDLSISPTGRFRI